MSASWNSSRTPMNASSEVVLSMLLNSLPSGGTMMRAACGSTIRRIALEYFRPARLDDQIAVHSVLTEVTGARLKVLQRVRRGEALLPLPNVQFWEAENPC